MSEQFMRGWNDISTKQAKAVERTLKRPFTEFHHLFHVLKHVAICPSGMTFNTAISMFIIEGMGFGRGEGVLDLSKNRVDKFMHMLDPKLLTDEQANRIKDAFMPLLTRDVLEIADELECNDRQHFDDVVIEEFGLPKCRKRHDL